MRFRGLAVVPLLAALSPLATLCAAPASGQTSQEAAAGFDRPGLELVLRSDAGDATDARVARLAALYVPEGEPSSPFFEPGPFEATFRGAIDIDLNDSFRFAVRGNGGVRLSIDGQVVLERDALPANGAPVSTDGEVRLRKGLNPVELVYRSPARGDARMRLTWSNDYLPEEPVPPAFLRHAGSPPLERGRSRRAARDLVADAMCVRCHNAAEVAEAPASRMPETTQAGPDLEGIGSRLRRPWIERWLLDPRSLRPRARMPKVLSTDAGEARRQAADLAAYLATTANGGRVEEAAVPEVDLSVGDRLYAEIGCAACHGDQTSPPGVAGAPRLIASSGSDRAAPASGPLGAPASPPASGKSTRDNEDPVLRLGNKWHPPALAAWLLDPTRFDAASRMPRTALEVGEAASLAAYLLAAAPDDGTTRALSDSGSGDPERGRMLAEDLGCRGCHSLPGGEPPPAALPLQRLAGSAEVWTTAAGEAARHPRYDFTQPEVEAIERLLAEDATSFSRVVPIEYAERRVRLSGCLACHSRDGAAASWSPPRPAAVEAAGENAADSLFTPATETDEETGPDHLPPDLTWAGEKLRSDWLEDYLAGRLDDRPRPHLRVRMPAFTRHADLLATGLHHQHGLTASPPDPGPADGELAAVGRDLIRGDRLGCQACHALGDEPALGGEGSEETINFDLVRRRLRRPFFDWFLRDPQRILPGSKMPQFVDEDGYTALYDVFDGEATRQFEAIWQYLGTID